LVDIIIQAGYFICKQTNTNLITPINSPLMKSIERYLERIGIKTVRKPSEDFLQAIQLAHLTSVPYENLDLITGRAQPLSSDYLYDKIVVQRRGGYCFELNGALAWLLRSLGFKFTELFARWHLGEPIEITQRRHRILKVNLGKRTLIADAGIGCPCPLSPLVFEENTPQKQLDGAIYRIVKSDTVGWMVQTYLDDQFKDYFSFSEDPQYPIDFAYPHFYCSHHPKSPFNSKTMVNLPTHDGGRKSVADAVDPETNELTRQFKITLSKDEKSEFFVRSDAQFIQQLKIHFGIELPEDFFATR
jgi:arylamine N-acetyltransferase